MIAFIICIGINVSHIACKFLAFNSKCLGIENVDLACDQVSLSSLNGFFGSGCDVLAEVIDDNRSGLKSSGIIGSDSFSFCSLCDRILEVRLPVDLTI